MQALVSIGEGVEGGEQWACTHSAKIKQDTKHEYIEKSNKQEKTLNKRAEQL